LVDIETRACGVCTACCDGWLRTRILGQSVRPGKPCQHADQGCAIYPVRPQRPCKSFFCEWLGDASMPNWMVPRISRAIIQADYLWFKPDGDVPVQLVTAAALKIPRRTVDWLRQHAIAQGLRYLCKEYVREDDKFTGDTRVFGIGPPEFEAEVASVIAAGGEIRVAFRKMVGRGGKRWGRVF
jgi:hypothetical protein